MLKIGDLASRSGVSIRTLHHCDEVGLLSPSGRTESGRRLYGRGLGGRVSDYMKKALS